MMLKIFTMRHFEISYKNTWKCDVQWRLLFFARTLPSANTVLSELVLCSARSSSQPPRDLPRRRTLGNVERWVRRVRMTLSAAESSIDYTQVAQHLDKKQVTCLADRLRLPWLGVVTRMMKEDLWLVWNNWEIRYKYRNEPTNLGKATHGQKVYCRWYQFWTDQENMCSSESKAYLAEHDEREFLVQPFHLCSPIQVFVSSGIVI